MNERQRIAASSSGLIQWGAIAVGILVIVVVSLPSVKGWLNRVPHLWQVLYPLLSLFAVSLVVYAIAAHEKVVDIVAWVVLLVAALSSTVAVYGGSRAFSVVGRCAALLFVIGEIALTVVEATRDGDADEEAP